MVVMIIVAILVQFSGSTPVPASELSSGQKFVVRLFGVLGTAAMMYISAKRSVNMGWSGWTCLYLPVQEACLLISPGPRRGKVNIAPADEGGSDEVSRLL